MEKIFSRPDTLIDTPLHYCPGCSHGIIHRLIAEVIEGNNIEKDTTAVASVGCSCFLEDYFDYDVIAAAHGRAPAVATGVKRMNPKKVVFTYQGDGDLSSIGTAEIIHAATRGENITVFFINNGIYGMTGGQMAPTTLIGQKATTAPRGRNEKTSGYPIKMSEMLALQKGAQYIARVAVNNPKNIKDAKRKINKAFKYQLKNVGFTLIEILAICPTNWNLSVEKSLNWLKNSMEKEYPLGNIKVPDEGATK